MHPRGSQLVTVSLIVWIAAFSLAGCGGSLFSYKGDKITQQDLLVQLQEGNQQGVWKTTELEIAYQYRMASDMLKIDGTAELVTGNRYFSRLSVYLLFLDNQGIVVENTLVFSSGNVRRIVSIPMDFEKTIPVPEGARTISFVYDLIPAYGGK